MTLSIKELQGLEAKRTQGEWEQSHRELPDGMYSTEVYDVKGDAICSLAWHTVYIDENHITTDRAENAQFIAADFLEKVTEV